MARVTVYDKDGKAHEKESVDARECVDVLGWTLKGPGEAEATQEGFNWNSLTAAQLKDALDERGIEYKASATKAELINLLSD